MKLLSSFLTMTNLSSSGAAAGFPVSNIADTEPMKRWVAGAYAGYVWVKAQIASAIGSVFLNRCNFPHAHVQWNATDSWGSPTVDQGVDLVQDDAGNRKAWVDLPANGAGYIRILIPGSQSLDNLETVPAIGNLIVGTAATFPTVSDFNPRLLRRFDRFESRAGAVTKTPLGRARHIIQFGIGDSLANVRAMPKTWDLGVIFADLGNAGESWLVFPPEDWDRPIRSVLDAQLRFALEEKP